MQNLLVKKGLIDTSMSQDELEAFVNEMALTKRSEMQPETPQGPKARKSGGGARAVVNSKPKEVSKKGKNCVGATSQSSESEVTIYRKAVKQIAPELTDQIEGFITQVRQEVQKKRNVSFCHHQTSLWTRAMKLTMVNQLLLG